MPQIQYGFHKNDEYYTPSYAVDPIVPYLNAKSKIWCPFDTDESQFVKVFKSNGFDVYNTHISTGNDFFITNVPDVDYIISNPPYSQKNAVIERLFEIGKPFAMLINMQGIFDCKHRYDMFNTHRFEMMWLYPRIDYTTPDESNKNGVPFQSGYIMSGISDSQITLEYVIKE